MGGAFGFFAGIALIILAVGVASYLVDRKGK